MRMCAAWDPRLGEPQQDGGDLVSRKAASRLRPQLCQTCNVCFSEGYLKADRRLATPFLLLRL
jgi:hypothetical protein